METLQSTPNGTFTRAGAARGLPNGLISPAGHTHRISAGGLRFAISGLGRGMAI
jgi:hypothetical protein